VKREFLQIFIFLFYPTQESNIKEDRTPGVSLAFSAVGQLVFMGGQNYLN